MTAQINEMQFKKQEEVKLSVEGVEKNDALISPIDYMLMSLFGAKIEKIEPGIFDYNIAISIKKDKKGINQLSISVRASEPDIPDSGQMNLFGGVESFSAENEKKLNEFFNKESKPDIGSGQSISDILEIKNRPENKKFSKRKIIL